MKRALSLAAAHALLCAALAPARQPPPAAYAGRQQPQPRQTPAPTPQPPPQDRPVEIDDDEVVRITTNLVQMDVVVTDKRGRQVTDLTADDFEIFEDGRPRKITNFSYVSVGPPPSSAPDAGPTPTTAAPAAVPRARLRPEQVRRTIALVVDDLGLSFADVVFARRALRKFVDEQMQPNDLVAVIRTSAGVGALQQFTSDRRQLHAAIERVKWTAAGRGGIGVFQPVERDVVAEAQAAAGPTLAGRRGGDDARGGGPSDADNARASLEDFREELFSVGTLGAINFVVRGMRELPGRKSVILFSQGFSLHTPDRGTGRSDRVLQALRRLVDLATRASVVVYTIDVRGLVYTGPTAADNMSGMSGRQISETMSERSQFLFDTQAGLSFLAEETGGLAFKNTNDISAGVGKVLEDQQGYYLIGYRPEGETFDRRFHRLTAKVKNRPDLSVRMRRGFYGVPDEAARPAARTPQQQLLAALMSPFAAGDVRLRMSAFFTSAPEVGPVVSAVTHLDVRDLHFTQLADGQHEARMQVISVAFGDGGQVVDQYYADQTMRVTKEVFERAMRSGLVYTFNVPVKKPGAYQMRMAVRDSASGRTGSASQFVEVPDLKKNRLALSGVVVSGTLEPAAGGARQGGDPARGGGGAAASGGGAQSAAPADGAVEAAPDPEATTAVRRFRQRMLLDYALLVFNARADRATGRPQLTSRTLLYREGRPVYSGPEKPIPLLADADPKRLALLGRLQLGSDLPPGDYVLQVVVTDALAKPGDKYRTASQWIDFEVVK
jgi:VWFA-related protein